jgi:hypothetical protein
VFGASDTLPQQGRDWVFSFGYRGLTSNDHYSGTQFQYARKANETYVINTQQLYDLSATYFFDNRWSASFSLPVVNASWALPTPIAPVPPGPRAEQNASGIGDVILSGRFWAFDPEKHRRGNLSIGLGVKAPTGDYEKEDSYPNINGTNDTEKVVDLSIQPGDGGWGYLFDLQGYMAWKHVSWYGSGSYLVNPRDTNGAPSIVVGLVGANPAFGTRVENTVPDQYLLRTGALFPVGQTKLGLNLGFRMEGLPRYDLVGDSHGFRRPGYETFLEPGFVYTIGRQTLSLYVPIGLVQNRRPDPYTGNAGDATFPEYIILAGYSYHFSPGGLPSRKPTIPAGESPMPEHPVTPPPGR